MLSPQSRLLPDGRRLHLHHGPIDLIIEVWGDARATAYTAATERFQTILQELADELPALRTEARVGRTFDGPTARRMQAAVAPYAETAFVTPMAAVAGAVADEILAAMTGAAAFDKAYVNNGGDTAFHLAHGERIDAHIAASTPGRITVHDDSPHRGIATSGWQGRSHSLGIADSVSVVADGAAAADVAATLIANAVDLPDHPEVRRTPARELSPDSDLGARLVTTAVGHLTDGDVSQALDKGTQCARHTLARGLIAGALLIMGTAVRHVGMADQIDISERTPLNA